MEEFICSSTHANFAWLACHTLLYDTLHADVGKKINNGWQMGQGQKVNNCQPEK